MTEPTREELIEALAFYADPFTWWAISLLADHPAGAITEDFSIADEDWHERPRPGKRARETLGIPQHDWAPDEEDRQPRNLRAPWEVVIRLPDDTEAPLAGCKVVAKSGDKEEDCENFSEEKIRMYQEMADLLDFFLKDE